MRTATEKYNAVLEGKFAKAEFVRQMRLEFPQLITQFNGFDDSVTILKNRGMIFEAKKEDKKIKPLEDNLPLEAIDRGVDVELTAMGIDPTGVVTKEQYMQAKKRAVSNLQKNQTHYIDLIAKESPSVDKNDKMKETKRGAKDVDSKNQMKNATLKEGVEEADAIPTEPGVPGERASNHERKMVLKQIIDFLTVKGHPETGFTVSTDDALSYIKTHRDDIFNGTVDYNNIEAVWGDYDEFESVNRRDELAVDRMGRPKIDTEPSRFKGRDKSILRTQSDKEDEVEEAVNAYTPGDMFSTDFDYEGMLKAGLKIRINTPIDTMQKIYDSFEDVNYHRENAHLYEVMEAIKEGDKSAALDHLKMFRKEIKETLSGLIEGVFPIRERDADYVPRNGAAVNEYRGSGDEIIEVIKGMAMEMDGDEIEAAMEVMEFIGEHYKIDFEFGRAGGGNYGRNQGAPYEENVKEAEVQSHTDELEDATFPVAEAFKKVGIDMSKDVHVHYTDGGPPGLGAGQLKDLGTQSPEKVIKMLEAKRLQEIEQYKEDSKDAGYEMEYPVMYEYVYYAGEKFMPKTEDGVKEFKLTWSIFEGESYDIFQESSGVSEKKGKDHDGDGDVDGDDYKAAKDKAIKKAMGKDVEEAAIPEKNITLADALERYSLGELLDTAEEFYRDQEENDSADMSAQFARQFRKSLDDFDGGIDRNPDLAETKKGKNLREAVKAIISKVLEEGTINEAATNELARIADDYAGFEGMKGAILDLQNLVTDIEAYYDKTRDKIQKVYDKLGEIRNEEGLKVGGFLAPAIETAFMKDLRPVTKQGFTKGLDQPKVKVLSQADVDAHNSGERPLGEDEFSPEPKKTVYTPNI